MNKKRIALVTVDHLVNSALTKQLMNVFKNKVEIVQKYLHDSDVIDVKGMDIVLCSSKAIEKDVKAKINQNIPIMPLRRTIDLKNISELISLDTGLEVLLVNNYLSTANETIEILKKLGVDHIKFIPYYPGCNENIRDIAVTPGGRHLVPKGVKKVIDIGLRIIDISSIIEIFLKLNLPTEELPILSAEYSKEMIRMNKYLYESNKMLKAMFEVTNDGIAALDINGNIFFCNDKFSHLLGYNSSQLISMNITEIIKNDKIIDIMLDSGQRNNEIVNINNKEYMLNKTLLYYGEHLKLHLISIQEVFHIQNLEKEVRKRLVRTGFVAKYDFNDLVGKSKILQSKIRISKENCK